MNIQLDAIYLPRFITCPSANFVGEMNQYLIKNLQFLSACIRHNQITLAVSTLGINLSLAALTDKIIEVISSKITFEFWQKAWVQQSAQLLSKSIIVFGGLAAINRLMSLQMTALYMTVSVVSTIALQLLWQKLISPKVNQFWDNWKSKTAEKVDEPEGEVDKEETPVEEVKKEEEAIELKVEPEAKVETEKLNEEEKPKEVEIQDEILDDKKLEPLPPVPTEKVPLDPAPKQPPKPHVDDFDMTDEFGTGSLLETTTLKRTLADLEGMA